MLFKIVGSLLILSASSLLGYICSKDCARRPQELRTLQGLLQMLENEMCFLSNLLTDSFERIHKSSDSEVARFFYSTVENLKNNEGMDAAAAWEMAVRENRSRTGLNEEDEQILISFGKMLGSSDLEGQIKNIRLTLTHLRMQEQKAEEVRKKNEAMYRSLGVLGGLAVVIILL
ncbi:MAG: stage III sporulation protein SpoIIIAB [Clostridiales bacterium]|jgi:stage III sporulation protein AB|nr:stage III sporulation protein SpoIIIAB [Eubacteriales bacterium]MDH7565242.1 stage III sporulation protein SpoIIIAB [Clostridiales bacterium]